MKQITIITLIPDYWHYSAVALAKESSATTDSPAVELTVADGFAESAGGGEGGEQNGAAWISPARTGASGAKNLTRRPLSTQEFKDYASEQSGAGATGFPKFQTAEQRLETGECPVASPIQGRRLSNLCRAGRGRKGNWPAGGLQRRRRKSVHREAGRFQGKAVIFSKTGRDASQEPRLFYFKPVCKSLASADSFPTMKAILALEDGSVFHGTGFGAARLRAAKFVSTPR